METQKTKNILVVDDEAVSIYVAKNTLDPFYNVESVNNGHDALEILKTKHFDMVLLDINLGDDRMDGIRVMRMIRKENKYRFTKLVAVTAYSDMGDWYISEGFDGFFMKPFIGKQAMELIREVFENSKQDVVLSE